jgi:histidinol-phosphate aminotransferase
VVVDEAYIDFGGETAIPLTKTFPNLLIIQTLSKSRSLAGLRVGFAVGAEDLIEGLERTKNSFNSYTLDRLALAGSLEAIKDEEYLQMTCRKVIATREWTARELGKLGFFVVPSRANFLLIRHERLPARELFQKLRNEGILVRYFDKPRVRNYLRVTIGTEEEMKTFIEKLGLFV